MERPAEESSLRRAFSDTTNGLKTIRFWAGEVMIGAVIGWVTATNDVPEQVPQVLDSGYPYISVVLGILTFAIIVFVGNLALGSHWQLSELTAKVKVKSQIQMWFREYGQVSLGNDSIAWTFECTIVNLDLEHSLGVSSIRLELVRGQVT